MPTSPACGTASAPSADRWTSWPNREPSLRTTSNAPLTTTSTRLGANVAERFVDALERALDRLARQPQLGSLRFAYDLDIPDLRTWPVHRFPYLIFYVEQDDRLADFRSAVVKPGQGPLAREPEGGGESKSVDLERRREPDRGVLHPRRRERREFLAPLLAE